MPALPRYELEYRPALPSLSVCSCEPAARALLIVSKQSTVLRKTDTHRINTTYSAASSSWKPSRPTKIMRSFNEYRVIQDIFVGSGIPH